MTRYVIGRSATNDIVISDASVSRVHAELRPVPSGSGYQLVDLGSTYGTGVLRGGHWIQIQESEVADADPIRLGDYVTSVRQLLDTAGIDPDAAGEHSEHGEPDQLPTKRNRQHGAPLPRSGPQTTVLEFPKRRVWPIAAIAGVLVVAAAVAGAVIVLDGDSTKRKFVDLCIGKGSPPPTCRCLGDVLDRNLGEPEFRTVLGSYRNSALPRLAITNQVLKLSPLLVDCYR